MNTTRLALALFVYLPRRCASRNLAILRMVVFSGGWQSATQRAAMRRNYRNGFFLIGVGGRRCFFFSEGGGRNEEVAR